MQTEAEAFLQRIRAYPDDDAPRLIFADWLEEQGERFPGAAERAKFIRVQIALARMAEEEVRDTDLGNTARTEREEARGNLLNDERILLDAHREEWTAPFKAVASGPELRRGFVEEVKVVARQFLRHAYELFDAGPLRHIHLLDVGGSLPAVLQCPLLSRLNALTMYGTHIGEPLARAVSRAAHLANLKTLHLGRNRFENDSAEHFAASPILANLEELDLAENELGETGGRALAASPHLGALRRLELRGNRLGPAGAAALAGSERLVSLQHLGLAENEIGVARLLSLTRAHDLLRVPVLDLSTNVLTAAGLRVILTCPPGPVEPGFVRLRELVLSHNELGNDGARVLAACPHLAELRTLRLVGCGIGDDGIRALAESPHLNQLVTLEVVNNPIGDPGCRAFLETPHMHSLRRLLVPGVGISLRVRQLLRQQYRG